MKTNNSLYFCAPAIILAHVVFFGCAAMPRTDAHPSLDLVALPTQGWRVDDGFSGSSMSIPALGKVTVLDFWATWCAPCKKTVIPELEALWRRVDRTRVSVVGVSTDKGQNADALVRETIATAIPGGVTFPMVLDGSAAELENAYKVRGTVPSTFVIDKRGRVRFYFDGSGDDMDRLAQAVAALVDELN